MIKRVLISILALGAAVGVFAGLDLSSAAVPGSRASDIVRLTSRLSGPPSKDPSAVLMMYLLTSVDWLVVCVASFGAGMAGAAVALLGHGHREESLATCGIVVLAIALILRLYLIVPVGATVIGGLMCAAGLWSVWCLPLVGKEGRGES